MRSSDGFPELAAELRERFEGWGRDLRPWDEGVFSALALRAFELQFAANPPYRRYCEARQAAPDRLSSWREIPPVPTAAFREVSLIVGGEAAARLEFLTSGTTGGGARRGRHPVRDPELYRASLEAGFGHWVAQGEERFAMLTLLPDFTRASPSSLGWMGEAVVARFGSGRACRPIESGARAPDWEGALAAAEGAAERGEPLCILATTLALDEWLGHLAARGISLRLPAGSRLMDTGGAKGREGLDRGAVAAAVRDRLGIAPRLVINELGMTELLSQRYAALERSAAGCPFPEAGVHYGPPWLRTRALDPVSLEELAEGEPGVLCHFDLANAGSVCAVLTEDLGRVRGGAVDWVGRVPGAPPRGCSLATAELLAALDA